MPRRSVEQQSIILSRIHRAAADGSSSIFVAPSTTPTTLYRLEKNLIQSLSTPFSLSPRSFQSDETSSALVEVLPRAREASLPAKAAQPGQPL